MYELEVQIRFSSTIVDGPLGVYAAEQRSSISLHLWLSHHLGNDDDEVVVVPAAQLLGVSSSLIRLSFDRVIDEGDLVNNAQLCIRQYVETSTESGLACRDDAGSLNILLSTLFKEPVRRALVMRTGDNGDIVKGHVHFERVRVLRDGEPLRRINEIVAFAPPQRYQWVPREDDQQRFEGVQRTVDSAIDQALAMYYRTPPLICQFPSVLNAHCPNYTLDFARLPAAAYLLHVSRRPSDADIYRMSATAALQTADVRAEDLVLVARRQFESPRSMLPSTYRLVDVMANMFSVVTHAMTVYENDFVLEHGRAVISENFKEAEDEDAADCEDSGKMNYKLEMQFKSVRFERRNSALDELLRAYQSIIFERRWYLFGLVIPAIVTNKALDARAIEGDDINAHTFAVAMPTLAAREHIVDYPARGIDGLAAQALGAPEFADYERHERSWHTQLPVLVLEGTAPSDALPLPVGAYYDAADASAELIGAARAIIEARTRAQTALMDAGLPAAIQLDSSQHTFVYSEAMRKGVEDTSSFYKIVTTLVLSLQRTSTLSFGAFTARDDGTLAYGVSWSEFTTLRYPSRLRLVPEYAFDEPLRAIVDDALAIAQPVPPLLRSEERARAFYLSDTLREFEREIANTFECDVNADPPSLCSSSVLQHDVRVLPLPGALVVLRVRYRDLATDRAAQRQLAHALETTKTHFSRIRIQLFHFADVPVRGESRLSDVEAVYVFCYLATP